MSDNTPLPSLDQLAALLKRCDAMLSPSELQGYLIGQLAAGACLNGQDWLEEAASYSQWVTSPDAQESHLLLTLYSIAKDELRSGQMSLQLLLPDDDAGLPVRIGALEQWCQGFIIGCTSAIHLLPKRQRPDNVVEALQDIATMSQIGVSDNKANNEQNERDYFTVCYYLRLAVLTIYMDSVLPAADNLPAQHKAVADSAVRSPAHLFGQHKVSDKTLH